MHEYMYPDVVETPACYRRRTAESFKYKEREMVEDLGPRLITHNENQITYYERQKEQAEKDLARLSLVYSGQLQLEFPDEQS